MRLGAFGHLAANRHHRIQRRHRLLEDHGDLPAAQPPQGRRRLPEKVNRWEVARTGTAQLRPSATESAPQPAPPAPAAP